MLRRSFIFVLMCLAISGCAGVPGVPYVEPSSNPQNAHLESGPAAVIFLIDDFNCKGKSFELTPGLHRTTCYCFQPEGGINHISINNLCFVFEAKSGETYTVEARRLGMTWQTWVRNQNFVTVAQPEQ